jgi:acyl-CoA thioester hydrolase
MSTGPSRPAGATQISSIEHRVNYSETDQMGVVYHARYVVWLDMARTEHLRGAGFTYRRMEEEGVFLAVTDLRVRYRQPARYDELIRIRCWVRDLASRRVNFGYAVERAETAALLATAETALIALTTRHTLSRIPEHVLALLQTAPDPVRL